MVLPPVRLVASTDDSICTNSGESTSRRRSHRYTTVGVASATIPPQTSATATISRIAAASRKGISPHDSAPGSRRRPESSSAALASPAARHRSSKPGENRFLVGENPIELLLVAQQAIQLRLVR